MILEVLNQEMEKLNINYSFMRYIDDVPRYPYFVGDYIETEYSEEEQKTSGSINISGWSRNNLLELIDVQETLKKHFNQFSIVKDGCTVVINYDAGSVIDSGEAELYKIIVRLSFKEWKGDV